MLLKQIESIVFFVSDIEAAAAWYAELFQAEVQHENSQYAFIQAAGCLLGFHPLDSKCPGGVGGTTVYWEVADLDVAIKALEHRGAVLYRGPISTSLGARAAMLLDPFGCTIGLNAGAGHR
ncbi:VOC family protein [Comamonas sp.]|uniref:VOC family protein n=1 Tax=Comamonas sp. TaxID=34028 RepID=UPI003A919D15